MESYPPLFLKKTGASVLIKLQSGTTSTTEGFGPGFGGFWGALGGFRGLELRVLGVWGALGGGLGA